MRIGTWNLAGRWDARHEDVLSEMDCDVLLLTEVSERVEIPGYRQHFGQRLMASRRHWAAVVSRLPASPLPDPHGASAMVEVDGLGVCSSILPWRSCGDREPWSGAHAAERTAEAVAAVEAAAPMVWGGDWNHALSGREWAGSLAGRASIMGVVHRLHLTVPTASSPHQIEGLLSIDHIAVPTSWTVNSVRRCRAFVGDAPISDHDAYVIDVERI